MIKYFFFIVLISCGKPIKDKSDQSHSEKDSLLKGVSEKILLDLKMSLTFLYLPLEGEVRKKNHFWSGDSWRLKLGAINLRWNTENLQGFNYDSPLRREVFTYPVQLMKKLSPAEKYDLFMGRYDYPLKQRVEALSRTATEDWEGLCHGWAAASIHHPEPGPKVVTNPDGVEIPFGSADIKALLSYAYSELLIKEEDSLGKRCRDEILENDSNCHDDLSPVSFHVVLSNKIGLRGQSVIADMDRFIEVWNHPIVSYEAKIEEMISIPSGRKVRIRTKIRYVDLVNKHTWEKHPPVFSHMTVRYELYLDKSGSITQGRWLSRERPDFLWIIDRPEKIQGYMGKVFDLLK